MLWKHKCSLDWMKTRQCYLTASDIKELLPVTKTGRARKVTEENFWKVYANKIIQLTDDDTWSNGVMARGHLLEPYAIQAYNEWADEGRGRHLYHWDDMVVPRYDYGYQHLAFSPDAMSFEQPYKDVARYDNEIPESTVIGEVKSYSPDRHLISINTKPKDLEERWQIATAMACSKNILAALLIFFNPALKEDKLSFNTYVRSDLEEEIEIIEDIESKWIAFLDCIEDERVLTLPCNITEQEIIEKIESPLNPV